MDRMESQGDSERPCPTCRVRALEPAVISVAVNWDEFELCREVTIEPIIELSDWRSVVHTTSVCPSLCWRDVCISLDRWLI
ncbi:MAG: hypothetical protein AAF664_01475 [Planctomycetota bacterium]